MMEMNAGGGAPLNMEKLMIVHRGSVKIRQGGSGVNFSLQDKGVRLGIREGDGTDPR
jgi:hypothetical protein